MAHIMIDPLTTTAEISTPKMALPPAPTPSLSHLGHAHALIIGLAQGHIEGHIHADGLVPGQGGAPAHIRGIVIIIIITGRRLTTAHKDTPIQGQGQGHQDVTDHHLHAMMLVTLLPCTPVYSQEDVNLDLVFYLILILELG